MSAGSLPILSMLAVVAAAGALQAALRSSRAGVATARLDGAEAAGPPAWLGEVLVALDVAVSPAQAWPWVRRGAAVAAVVLVLRWPLLVVVAVAGGGAIVGGMRARARGALAEERERGLPVLIDDVVAAMASGSSLPQALAAAAQRPGPLALELRSVLRAQGRGRALQDVLDDWAGAWPSSGLGLVADALALAGATGGSQVAALQSVGATLREREARQREVRAMAAQAQLSAMVLVVTPVGFAAVVAVLDHRIAAFLLASPLGWACLLGGVALDGAGAWWMRRLVGSVS